MHKYTWQDSVRLCFKVSHSMRPPKPTCQRNPMSWGWSRLSSSSFSRKKKVSRPACKCASFSFMSLFLDGSVNQTARVDKNASFMCDVLAWCYGERMRDGERGWFPASCATEITNPTAMENNVQRMKRLRKETNVWATRETRAWTTGAICYFVLPNTRNVSQQHIPSEVKNHMRAHPVDVSPPFVTGQVDPLIFSNVNHCI